jgi:hypothetical protein
MPPSGPAVREAWNAAGLALLAAVYLVAARRYPLDSLSAPGPGVFPLLLGALLLVLAIAQLIVVIRARGGSGGSGGSGAALPAQYSIRDERSPAAPRPSGREAAEPGAVEGTGGPWGGQPEAGTGEPVGAREPEPAPRHARPLAMTGALVAYAAAIPVVGFLTVSGVLVVVAARLMGTRGWGRPVLLALGVVVATYFLFAVWLGVPLPAGRFR